ncbi:benzodiazepine receptor binding [Mactra antiquata]
MLPSKLQGKIFPFLREVNEECSTLRLSLSDAQHECEVAKGEVTALQLKVQNLETVVQNLEFSTERLKQVEKDYHDTLVRLEEKQQEIDQLQKVQESAREKYETAIKSLQDKIKNLETQCQDHASKQQTLTEELSHLHAQAALKSKNSQNREIQTSDSLDFVPSRTSTPNQSPRRSPTPSGSARKSPRTNINSTPVKTPSNVTPLLTPSGKSQSQSLQSPSASNKGLNSKGSSPLHDEKQVQHGFTSQPVPAKRVNGLNEQSDSTKSGGTDTDKADDSGMESRGDQCREPEVSEMSVEESLLSMLSKKGPIQVYIAKYSYDPFNYSPNENPEAELPLQAGDYVLVIGEMDEDGFFDGELVDGRRGLVPSNFIEKVAEDDLPDFHSALRMGGHDNRSATSSIVVPDLEIDSGDEEELIKPDQLVPETTIKNEPSSDLDNILEEEEEISLSKHSMYDVHQGAPFPKNLQLERQLANSILVSWLPPENPAGADIRSYHVFLDGDFKTAIRGNERTKVLLENVESRKIHRVSVRCISSLGQSHDNQCTILVGKDVIPTPFDLRLGEITANSASISWTPGDSCLHHAIYVNNNEVRVVEPGVYTYMLTGLSPAMKHSVRIQAKNLHGKLDENNIKPEKLSSTIEFKTASGGIPDPPICVAVESGPQEGSILMTWLPVTIDTAGFSNGALLSGYNVYGDGHKIKQVHGATNDHCILSVADFTGPVPKELWVRTVTMDKIESMNSVVIKLPSALLKELSPSAIKTSNEPVTQNKSPVQGKLPEDVIALEKQEKHEVHKGKSPVKSLTSPSIEQKKNITSPQNVPVIEITCESSVERSLSKHSDDEHNDINLDSMDTSVKSSKTSPDISVDTNTKYSAKMDTRDGYRDDMTPSSHSTHSKDHSKRDKYDDNSRKHNDSRSNVGASPNSMTGRGSSPRQSKSASPGARGSPRVRDSRESPRSRSSPCRSDHHKSHDHHKSGASPHRDQAGQQPRNEASSPSSKSNIKSGYPVEPLELSKLDQSKGGNYADSDDDSITGEINPPVDDNQIRLFVALFDYDPETMSPNVDSLDEELPFKEGQIIKVFGDKDPDGFYRGECAGRIGYIPCNMVSEIQVDDPELEQQLMREVQDSGSMSNSAISEQLSASDKYLKPIQTNGVHLSPGDIPSISSDLTVRRMVALYDYDPQELSPNVDAELELNFKAGEMVICYGEMDDDGFYMGEMDGRRGLVPSNFLQECGVSDEEALDSVSVVTPASLNSSNNNNNPGNRARVQAWSTPQQKWFTPNLIK